MRRRSSGFVVAAAAAVLGSVLAAHPGAADPASAPATDWLVAHVEKSASTTGRIGWDAFAPGSWVERASEPAAPETGTGPAAVSVSATHVRETLVERSDASTTVRVQLRIRRDRSWPEGSATPLPRTTAEPGELQAEVRDAVALEREGTKLTCTERTLRRTSGGKVVSTRVMWTDAAGRLVRWSQDDGDGWAVTYDVVREGVPFPLGDRVLTCRELRKRATSATMRVDVTATELWCPDVPDFLVRSETVMVGGPPGAQTTSPAQIVALVAMETRPADPAKPPAPAPATSPTPPPAPAAPPAPTPQPAK